jgi:L-lactate dehydrogenase (cytochrome)
MAATVVNVEDLRQIAGRRIPRAIFDYVDGGAYDEATLRANRSDLESIRLRQRVMVDVSGRSLAGSLVDQHVPMPVGLGPVAMTGLVHGNGEICAAQAAIAFGVPYCLSTLSICSIEDVREAVDGPFWFQLYMMRDRGFIKSLIERAANANCSALVVTLDLQVQGQRNKDIKNGLTVPPRLTLRNAVEITTRLPWAFKVLFGSRRTFGNLAGRLPGSENLTTLAAWIANQFDPSMTWKDIDWIRGIWPGKLILKGLMDLDDAKTAASLDVDAIVVSNHGGRQQDYAASSISILPAIAEAVGSETEVLFDGGIRSGQDVLKALALGANGCLLGRAYMYGLAARGKAGVTQVLEIIRKELDVSLALAGVRDIRDASQAISVDPSR